jgi:hypothetical protein
MWKLTLLLSLTVPFVTSCALGSAQPPQTPALPAVQAQTRIVDTSCDWVKAIYLAVSDIDVISPLLAREIDDHNKAGVQHCDWGK